MSVYKKNYVAGQVAECTTGKRVRTVWGGRSRVVSRDLCMFCSYAYPEDPAMPCNGRQQHVPCSRMSQRQPPGRSNGEHGWAMGVHDGTVWKDSGSRGAHGTNLKCLLFSIATIATNGAQIAPRAILYHDILAAHATSALPTIMQRVGAAVETSAARCCKSAATRAAPVATGGCS